MKNHLLYWLFPSAAILLLIGMYFSGQETLMWLVVPLGNREFGALESLQHLLLLIMAIIAARAAWRASLRDARVFYGLMALAAAFIFMEEINYGVQFWMLITGEQPDAVAHVDNLNYVNLHNQGELSDLFKDVGDGLLVLLFVIVPLATQRSENAWVKFFRPSRWFIVTLLCAYLASRFAHFLDDHFPPQTDYYQDSAIGEYRELFTYWIWFMYFRVLCNVRRWPATETAKSNREAV